jgi:P27 family predicted phage terminase small subunit
MGVLTLADKLALESLCEAVADLRNARDALAARGGVTYETVTMTGVLHRAYPEVAMVADCDRRVRMWMASFGLTPADRSRVSLAAKTDENDPAARFLGY